MRSAPFCFCRSSILEIRFADKMVWTEWSSSIVFSFIRFKYLKFSSLGNQKTTDCSSEVSEVQYLQQGMHNRFQTVNTMAGISQRARQSPFRCGTSYIEALMDMVSTLFKAQKAVKIVQVTYIHVIIFL